VEIGSTEAETGDGHQSPALNSLPRAYRIAVVWVSFLAMMAFRDTPWRAASTASARWRVLSMRTLNAPE